MWFFIDILPITRKTENVSHWRRIRPMKPALRRLAVLLSAAFLVGGASAWADTTAASIQIVGDAAPVAVPRTIFGQNVLGVDEYGTDAGGLWDPDQAPCAPQVKGCFDSNAMELVRDAGVRSLRFPGGTDARRYDWRGGVGDPSTRGVAFGTEEFLFLADSLGASPIMTVSAYDQTTHEPGTDDAVALAADWVQYANATTGPYAELREAVGHPEPHAVRTWELDSETWDAHANPFDPSDVYPALTPRTYAEAFVRFARAMKAVDPTIRLGAQVYENVDDTDLEVFLDWFVENDPDPELWPDFLTLQYYRPTFDSQYCDLEGRTYEEELAVYARGTMAAALQFQDRIRAVRRKIAEHWATRPDRADAIQFAVTEYGTWFHFADQVTDGTGRATADACPFKDLRFSLLAALYDADMLMQLAQLAPEVASADLWAMADDSTRPRKWLAGNVTHSCGPARERPAQWAFRMLAKDFALVDLVPALVQSPTIDSAALTRIEEATGIQPQAGEDYLRVRLTRQAEPIDEADYCGTDDSQNEDPGSWIRGALDLDDLRVFPEAFSQDSRANLLINGGFDSGLLGWKIGQGPAGTTAGRVCTGGACVFRISFDEEAGNPALSSALSQVIRVKQGTRYAFTARLRARGLSVKTRNLLCDSGFDFTGPAEGSFGNSYWEEDSTTPAPATLVQDTFVSSPKSTRVEFWGNPNYWQVAQGVFLHHESDPLLSDPSRFLLRAWMKAENMNGPGMVEAQERDSTGQAIARAEPIGLYGTTEWQRVERRFRLQYPDDTNMITFHLRRKDIAEETGGAMYFDSLGLFRDPIEYAPKLAVDLCADPACASPRTVLLDTVLGDAGWMERRLSGTPALAAVASRNGDSLSLIVLNRSFSDTLLTRVVVDGLADWPRDVWIGELNADSVDATNEGCLPAVTPGIPTPHVTYRGPGYWKTLTESGFDYAFPPHSLTAFRFVRPPVVVPPGGVGTPEPQGLASGVPHGPIHGDGCGCDLTGSGRARAEPGLALVLTLAAIWWRVLRARRGTTRRSGAPTV